MGLLYAIEEFAEFVCGYGAMAYFIFQFIAHLCKSLRVTFGYKYRIVSETRITSSGFDDFSFYKTLEQVFFSVNNQGKYCTKLCFPVFYSFHVVQEFQHICFCIVSVSGIAGRINSRFSIQCFHFQSGVIGKAVQLIVPVDKRRFQQGISFQCFCCFGDVRVAVNVIQTEQFYLCLLYTSPSPRDS